MYSSFTILGSIPSNHLSKSLRACRIPVAVPSEVDISFLASSSIACIFLGDAMLTLAALPAKYLATSASILAFKPLVSIVGLPLSFNLLIRRSAVAFISSRTALAFLTGLLLPLTAGIKDTTLITSCSKGSGVVVILPNNPLVSVRLMSFFSSFTGASI